MMKIFSLMKFLSLVALIVAGCSDEDCDLRHPDELLGLPVVKQGTFPEKDLNLKVGDIYEYAPQVSSPLDVYYRWRLGEEDQSRDLRYTFTATRPSRSVVRLDLTNDYGKVELENKVIVPGADYSKGCLIVNEGWFGSEPGSISYYNYVENTIEHWGYKAQNFGNTLGVTSQSATLWNGKLYICSKQEKNIVVVDPKTLYAEKESGSLTSYQTYEFIGLNEDYAVLTHSGYFSRLNLKTFETVTLMRIGDTYAGTGSGIVYNGKLLLNLAPSNWGTPNLYVMDVADLLVDDLQAMAQIPYQKLDVVTYGGTRFVTCEDGNLYTVETTKTGENNLVRIKPDFSYEKTSMRSDYAPSSFGSYREASFCGTSDGTFYYVAGGKIYKATFADAAPSTPFISYEKEGYGCYGAGIRVNTKTNELIAIYLTADYDKNLIVRFNATTGDKISEIQYDGYYFPATVIFND